MPDKALLQSMKDPIMKTQNSQERPPSEPRMRYAGSAAHLNFRIPTQA
jgi:hypothetical protein